MRSIYKSTAILLFLLIPCSNVFAQVVISQVYGGGGNTGATLTNDFIELFNSGVYAVSLTGWSVQYASASGTIWQTTALSGTIQPGQYYLVQEAQGSGGTTPLPTPDATGTIAMSAISGKVALVNTTAALSGSCPSGTIDFVGYGTADCYEGSASAPSITNTTSVSRIDDGCTDTEDNAVDFTTDAPDPRNTSSPSHLCSNPVNTVELFFSEYVEGSSNNKALEIFNPTGSAVDLAAGGYNIQMFFNGNTSAGLTINLTGNVAAGDVYVIAQSSADPAILAQADQTNGAGWFNGDDAVVLRKGTTILDVIGQIGNDPGTEWGTGLTSTADNTLRRKSSICSGDMDPNDAFDPAAEWDGYATDTFDGLGSHSSDCTISTFDIYIIDTHSGTSERATFIDDADEYNPSFNNNGKFIAHDVVSGSDPLGQSIYITDLATHTSTPLAGAEGGNDASWSPNGKYIAFDRNFNLYVVSASGGTATLVRENAVDAEWSNNSKRLVFMDITDGSLKTIDINGGSETDLGVQGRNASWSPDGKYIAYSDGNNIFTIAVNEAGEPDGTPVQLTFDGANTNNQQPSWSNDGKTIVFQKASGSMDIWTISSSGGTQQMLTGLPDYGDYDPCYSKNGKYVAYAGFTIDAAPKGNSNNEEPFTIDKNSLPDKYVLNQNFPNPFNPTTIIRYSLPENANVSLIVYDILGRQVAELINSEVDAGYHQVEFNASKLSSGMYFYKLTAGNFVQINKMLLLK
jgi:Tol biopolymer transport system component